MLLASPRCQRSHGEGALSATRRRHLSAGIARPIPVRKPQAIRERHRASRVLYWCDEDRQHLYVENGELNPDRLLAKPATNATKTQRRHLFLTESDHPIAFASIYGQLASHPSTKSTPICIR